MRKSKTTLKFQVTIDAPDKATIADAQAYISAAVSSAVGGLRPDDPMAELDRESVRVSLKERKTTYA